MSGTRSSSRSRPASRASKRAAAAPIVVDRIYAVPVTEVGGVMNKIRVKHRAGRTVVIESRIEAVMRGCVRRPSRLPTRAPHPHPPPATSSCP